MFGKLLEVKEKHIKIENTTNVSQPSIVNFHVIFDEEDRKVVAEVTSCDDKVIEANLIGEIRDNVFYSGVLRVPSFLKTCRIISKSELELLIGNQDYKAPNNLLIGR